MNKSFRKNILTLHGKKGQQWLEQLPSMIEAMSKVHGLSRLSPMENLTYNYVARGYQADRKIVLKVGLNASAFEREVCCLKAFSGAAPAVIASDHNMILMDCAMPGVTLKAQFSIDDMESTRVFCQLVKKLHASNNFPASHSFPPIRTVLEVLDRVWDIPTATLSEARKKRDALLGAPAGDVLLHGDLHHDNILQHGDGWLVIDPKGYVGDPAFELAAFLCNPMPDLLQESNVQKIVAARIRYCVKALDMQERRIWDWLFVKSVLCWVWCLQDGLDPSYWERFIASVF